MQTESLNVVADPESWHNAPEQSVEIEELDFAMFDQPEPIAVPAKPAHCIQVKCREWEPGEFTNDIYVDGKCWMTGVSFQQVRFMMAKAELEAIRRDK